MYPGADSLITVIQSVLVNPMKLLYECTSPEKVQFIGLTLLPLLGLPLLTRRYERYILLIPYILVNLMSDYPHQHQIFYQYSFGPAAFLFFLTAMNLAEWKIPKRRTLALMLAIMIALTGFVGLVVPKAATAPKQLLHNRTSVLAVRSILDEIPEEASVSATTYYACYLSQRKELYLLRYGTQEHILSSQYIVLNPELTDEYTNFVTSESENGLANLIALLESNGFEKVSELDNILMIYQRKDAV